MRKSFPLKGKAFLFKREDFSLSEGKLFPGFEKGVETLCIDNQCIKLRTDEVEKAVAVSGNAEQATEEGQTLVKLGAYSSVVFKLK